MGTGSRTTAFALLALLVEVAPARALDPSRSPTQYRLDSWTQDHGLPQNTVNEVLQTRDGYLWLGTEEGLVRFDGVRFTVFDRASTPALPSAFVAELAEDPAGGLWIGTYGGGVAYLADGRIRPLPAPPGLVIDRIGALHVDRSGDLLIGSAGGGLVRWRGDRATLQGRFEALTTREGLGGDRVSEVAETPDGTLFVAAYGGGLSRVAGRKVERVRLGSGPAASLVRSVLRDRQGRLWVATDGAGLFSLEGERVTAYGLRDGLSSERVRALAEDRDGNLWIATERGLDRLREGRIASLRRKDGLAADVILSLGEDREGSLWVGTAGGGLARLRDGKFLTLTPRDGLPASSVRPVVEDPEGALWVGMDGGGLARLRDGAVTTWSSRDGLPGDDVFGLCLARDGGLYVAADRGLARLAQGRVEWSVELPGGRIRSLLEDAAGRLWVGSTVGLFQLRGRELRPAALPGPLPDNPVRALLEDRAGRLQIGLDGGGLVTVHPDRLERRTRAEGLPSDRVFSLHEDDAGRLWIGTSGGGLARLREGRLAAFTRRDGLLDDVVFRILEDGDGFLWLSSNRGLSRVAKADLERFAAGETTHFASVGYGAADGMPSAECNGGSPAGTRTRDGRLWFPTNRGLVGVDPRHIPTNPLPPPVRVEAVEADGVPAGGAEPRLGPELLRLEIQYAALSLLAPERVRFRYRLEGLDRDWVEAGIRRAAYYTHVPAGSYRFRVKACNNDGVWNETGAELAFTVAPHWHETWLFRVLLGAGVLGAVGLGYRYRVSALTRRQGELQALVEERTARLREERAEAERLRCEADRQRERAEQASRAKSAFVAGMSHELRTPLNAVLGFVQLMERRAGRDAEDRQHLGIISRSGEHLLGLINGVLSLSKIEAGLATLEETPFDLRGLLEGLVEMFRPRAASRSLALECELDASLPRAVLGDEGKLRQIVINLLGNAFKFTEEGRVVLRARAAAGRVIIEVEDTGPGVAPEEADRLFEAFSQAEAGRRSREGTGLGLALSRDHARLMRGDLAVGPAPVRGCLFRLEVALPAHLGELPPRTPRIRQVTRLAPNQPAPRVLVVDDSPEERLLFGRLLEDVGYRVQEVASGEEALSAWRSSRPDALVLDLHLPGIDGLAVARTIRSREAEESAAGQRPSRRTGLVCVSASTLEGERERVLEAGGDAFLAKPFRDAALLAKLAELLGVRHAESAARPRPAPAADGQAIVAGLRGLGDAWRERLRASAAGGDSEALLAQLSELAAADPALASSLQPLIRGYRFDELETLLAAADERP